MTCRWPGLSVCLSWLVCWSLPLELNKSFVDKSTLSTSSRRLCAIGICENMHQHLFLQLATTASDPIQAENRIYGETSFSWQRRSCPMTQGSVAHPHWENESINGVFIVGRVESSHLSTSFRPNWRFRHCHYDAVILFVDSKIYSRFINWFYWWLIDWFIHSFIRAFVCEYCTICVLFKIDNKVKYFVRTTVPWNNGKSEKSNGQSSESSRTSTQIE